MYFDPFIYHNNNQNYICQISFESQFMSVFSFMYASVITSLYREKFTNEDGK